MSEVERESLDAKTWELVRKIRAEVSLRNYLILTKFREYLISRKVKRHISRVFNFAILRGNYNWSVLNFAIFCIL